MRYFCMRQFRKNRFSALLKKLLLSRRGYLIMNDKSEIRLKAANALRPFSEESFHSQRMLSFIERVKRSKEFQKSLVFGMINITPLIDEVLFE